VANNNTVGKLEKSKGLKVCKATISTINEINIFEVKKTSNKKTGRGITIIVIKIRIPMGKLILEINLITKFLSFFTVSII
jgi:hypothetical protein